MTLHIIMRGITKDFPGTRALDDVSLDIFGGEIHAIIGENGAGKSTLMKILAGEYSDYLGAIQIDGQSVRIKNAQDAGRLGIAMIFQELRLVPRMTVSQNIYLGKEPITRSKLVHKRKQEQDARKILESLKVSIPPREQVIRLSPAQRQVVEIAKAIASYPRVLIMDEPTSSLPLDETKILFGILRELKKRGVAILFISHKIEEIMAIADRVTVLRDGKLVSSNLITEISQDLIIRDMVGREIQNIFPTRKGKSGEIILSVRNLSSGDRFFNINFDLHEGEILGFYGLIGAGRTDVAESLFGMKEFFTGTVRRNHEIRKFRSVRDAVEAGIFLIPEDRRGKGLIPRMSVESNLTLSDLSSYSPKGVVNARLKKESALEMVNRLRIKTASENTLVEFLSGGNQQKVVVGKCLLTDPEIIIMDEPTRGIDVGTKAEIYDWMVALVCEGKGIIFITSELPEVLGLCDRILVFCEGRIAGELTKDEATPERIMYLATGAQIS
jgi:ABC-type sugar transport system ATPase subunit